MDWQELEDSLFEKDDSAYVDADKMTRPSLTYWSDAWRRFRGNRVAMVSAVILLIVILMAADCYYVHIAVSTVFRRMSVVGKFNAVETIQPVLRCKPHISDAILKDAPDTVAR